MKFNDALQWFGAVFIMIGHLLNTLGVEYHYDVLNIGAFAIGTLAFLVWTIRVSNKPQMTVNIVALIFMAFGLVKFFA
jgi:uncharacterized membrane protein